MTELVDYEIKYSHKNEKINIFFIGDIHLGNLGCDIKLLEKVLKGIPTFENYYIFGMGDYCEYITPRDKRFDINCTNRNILTPSEQKEKIFHYLEPFKGRIIGLHEGNHEGKIDKVYYHNVTKDLCRFLDTTYLGYMAFTDLCFRRYGKNNKRQHSTKLTVYSNHGSGMGVWKGSKINKLEQIAQWNKADIYVMGHVHELIRWEDSQTCKKGKNKVDAIRAYGITGGFLEGYAEGVPSYIERTQKKPTLRGCLRLEIIPEYRKIKFSPYWGD